MKWVVGNGIDEYIDKLEKLSHNGATGKAIYQGAKIVADECRKNINALPVQKTAKHNEYKVRGVTASQKKGLQEGFGISKVQFEGGFKHVKLGFDGYNDTITPTYTNGQPNAMIARIVESGNSYHVKTPFIAPAVNATKAKAEKTMALVIDKEISAIGWEGYTRSRL